MEDIWLGSLQVVLTCSGYYFIIFVCGQNLRLLLILKNQKIPKWKIFRINLKKIIMTR